MRVKDWSENLLAQRGWVATSWPCFLAGDTRDMPLPSSQNQEISNFSTHPSFPSWVSSLSNCKLLRGQFHQLAIYCLCPRFKVQLSWAVSGVSEYNQNIPQQPSPTIAYRCIQHVLFAPNTNEYSTSGGTEAFPLTERVIWTLASSVSPEHWREGVAMHHLGLSAQQSHAQPFDQLSVFALTAAYCKTKILWPRPRGTLVYRYKYKFLERGLKIHLLSETEVPPWSCDLPSHDLLKRFTGPDKNSLLWRRPQNQAESG